MSKGRHPSGRPIRDRYSNPKPRSWPIGTRDRFVVERLNDDPPAWLAGGAGFPINPNYDDYWELSGRKPAEGARRSGRRPR